MTLKELQQMIKEEFDALQNEAEGDEVDVAVSDDDVDVDAEMGEEEGAEDVLRNIYDMLKTRFETEDEMGDEMGDIPAEDDVEETVYEGEDDIEENATKEAKYQKQGMAAGGKTSSGANAGYGTPGGKGSTGYDESSKAFNGSHFSYRFSNKFTRFYKPDSIHSQTMF